MHGGAPGSGAPKANRNARKHGLFTGDAIAERYLALVRSPAYTTSSGRQVHAGNSRQKVHSPLVFSGGLLLEERLISKAFEVKIMRALEIFPEGREMPAKAVCNKVKRMGYGWDAREKSWQKLSR